MMGSQLYSRRDVRRLMAALAVFVVVPCVLLVFLAWQSVGVLHEAAQVQRRDACRRDLRDLGQAVGRALDDRLARAGETLRGLSPSASAFWIEAGRRLDAEPSLRAVLALDSSGRLAHPRGGPAWTDDEPRLSALHPAGAALRDARRAQRAGNDPARALERYRQVVDEPRTPPSVRLAVWAEMARCEERRGDVPAALQAYDRMLDEATNAVPPALVLLHAAELAKQAGDGARARRWTLALLDGCERRGAEMDADELAVVVDRLRDLWAADPGDLAARLEAAERLSAARAAGDAFVRAHGAGPFPFHSRGGRRDEFEPALLPSSAPADARLLVDVRAPLPGGDWLAFEIDPAAFRAVALEPALREWVARCGGHAEIVAAPPPGSVVAAEGPMVEPLPEPLEFWAVAYRAEPVSPWAALAASRSKTRAAILGLAAALALLGLAVPYVYLRRSLRLAGLQADMVDRISHELKTPMASLSVLADTLARRDGAGDPAADRQLRALLRDEVRRLVRLSGRLLDFARRREGNAPLNLESVRLDEWLAETVRRLPGETGVEAARLALDVRPGTYAGSFDRDALDEIARNLVENAVKYAGDGPAEVRISLRRDGVEAVLAVADDGPGMDARTLRHLFEPYFRADNRLAARVPGLGLGLAIVRGLVRAHGGAIAVRSSLGHGSVFEIRLPLLSDSGGRP